MTHWLVQRIFSIQIKALLVFKPAVLFHKINHLVWYQNTLYQWISSHKFSSNIKILEVGCATGSLSGHLAERGYVTTAVDSSASMILAAKTHNYKVDYHVSDVGNLTFNDNSFDAVVSASLINIISDQQSAINEMTRVCKQNGVISILFPAYTFSYKNLQELTLSLGVSGFSEAALRAWHKSAPKMHIHAAEVLLQKAGLKTALPLSYLQGMVASISATKIL